MNSTMFSIAGPFEIPLLIGNKKSFIPVNCAKFWGNYPMHKNDKGCYVFSLRAGKGFKPVYVGKTKNTFEKEIFTAHKIAQHYTPALAYKRRGTPVLFLVVAPKHMQGRQGLISELETYLIRFAVKKNPNLSNIKGKSDWGIEGIFNVGKGKASDNQGQFKKMMGI